MPRTLVNSPTVSGCSFSYIKSISSRSNQLLGDLPIAPLFRHSAMFVTIETAYRQLFFTFNFQPGFFRCYLIKYLDLQVSKMRSSQSARPNSANFLQHHLINLA